MTSQPYINRIAIAALSLVRWLVTTTGFLLTLAACIFGVSFLASYGTGQWHWFQRSGALLVSIGAVLSTRRQLRFGLTGLLAGTSYFDIARAYEKRHDYTHDRETSRDLTSSYWGFGVVGFGTMVWAFGDLIECLITHDMSCIS